MGMGLLISAFLIFVARPVGVFASLLFFKTSLRSKLFISWVGLRGGVPIVFATYPLIAGLAKAELIFNLVFFISVTSVLFQGTTLAYVANLLGVALPSRVKRLDPSVAREHRRSEMHQIELPATSGAIGRKVVELNIPLSVYIMSIRRDGEYIQPVGSTTFRKGDVLYVLADNKDALLQAYKSFDVHPAFNS
jgi:cell volume regulation protein A